MKEKKTRKRPEFPPPKKDKLPPFVCDSLEKAGLSVKDAVFCCAGDMDNSQCYCDSWVFFDPKGLYVIFGEEEHPEPRKLKKHKALPRYRVNTVVSIPAEDIDSLETERYASTGRLIVRKNGEQRPVTYFSLGLIGDFDRLIVAFNSFKETGEAKIRENPDEKNVCKKCGAPCPPGKDYCRRHAKTGGTAVRLVKFFGGYAPQIAAVLVMMILSSVTMIVVPQISTRALYDNVLANPDGKPVNEMLKALGTLVLSVVGIRFLRTLLEVAQDYVSAAVMPRVMYDIKLKIFEAMQRLSVSFYSSKQTGSLMDRVMRDANNIYWFFTEGVPRLIIDVATIIGVLFIMFRMSVRLSLFALISAPLLLLTLILGDRLFRRMHHSVWVHHAKLGSMLSDNINGQRVIKAFSKEDDELGRFEKTSMDTRNAEVKLGVTEATLFPLLEIAVLMLSTVVLGYGGIMAVRGESGMTTGTLLSFIVYLEMLKEPFGFLAWISNWWSRCADSAQRIFEICDAQPDITEKEDAVSPDIIKGHIQINELEFEYEPARPVINKLTIDVAPGEMLGIVGKTGAGKTTLANLIARLYDAKDGCILIDGIDVRDLKLDKLRKNIGLVSQDIYLFIGSIADNIRYAKPDATMGEVIAAAKAACAHDFIMKLPDAYQTRVGAGGQRLSGGERQRISIARTIIQNPGILILDEATAAMDTETERNIQHSLAMLTKGRTTIAIAHRLSTLRDSDKLAVIDEGRITEFGTFDELIDKKGEFYRLYDIQAQALKTIGIGEDEPKKETDESEDDKNEDR